MAASVSVEADDGVVIFDGLCKFCNGSVQWLLRHERDPRLRFAAAQSVSGAALRERCGLADAPLDSVVVVENGRAYQKSTAALRLLPYLRWPWQLLRVGWLVPRVLRDWLYDRFAARRYAWFGRSDTCMIPAPDVARRFLP